MLDVKLLSDPVRGRFLLVTFYGTGLITQMVVDGTLLTEL